MVSPLDNSNNDGYLRLINDDGISLESHVRTSSDMTIAGRLAVGSEDFVGKMYVRDDSTDSTGITVRNWRANARTQSYLRLDGVTPRAQGAWAQFSSLSGTDAGGDDASNHGGLKIDVSTGGNGTPNTAMRFNMTVTSIGTPRPAVVSHQRCGCPNQAPVVASDVPAFTCTIRRPVAAISRVQALPSKPMPTACISAHAQPARQHSLALAIAASHLMIRIVSA